MALFLVAITGTSARAGKPTVGILGLEVRDDSGNVDQASTAVARDLTDGLRSRARVSSGPYQLAAGPGKELIDEKLIKNCDSEAVGCMSDIGRDLGVDYLIFGRLEKKPDGYVVVINLLNVAKQRFEKTKTPLLIPYSQKDAIAIAASARKAYSELTGVTEYGTLVVRTSPAVDRGSVLLDDAQRATLSSGAATIKDIPEGRYRLVVESEGWQRSAEIQVTIRSGETTTQAITLAASSVGDSEGPDGSIIGKTGSVSDEGNGGWKKVAIVGGIATAGLGVGFGITWSRLARTGSFPDYGQHCNEGVLTAKEGTGATNQDCKDGATYKTLSWVTGVGMGVAGGLTLFAIYKAYIAKDERAPAGATTVGRRTKQRKTLSVTPVLAPDGGGATVQFDW